MKTQSTTVTGFPLDTNKYKDKDAIVTFLTRDSKIALIVNGGYLPTGKNHQATMVFNKVTLDLDSYSNDMYFVKGVTTITNNVSIYEDLERSSVLNFCREILLNMFIEGDELPYDYFEKAVDLMREKFDYLTVATIFLAQSLSLIGMKPTIDGCATCGRKDHIVHFSMNQGGFACKDCAIENQLLPTPSPLLKTMKYIFNVTPEEMGKKVIPEGLAKSALDLLLDFVRSEFDFKIKSTEFFL